MTVTLSVTEGTLTVTAGTSGAVVTSSGTSSVTITGTVAQINALLNTNATSTVTYVDNTDTPSATSTLTLSVNDNGNTGTGGNLVSTDTVDHQHHGGQRRPGGDHHAGQLLRHRAGQSLNLKNNGLSISDADAGSGVHDGDPVGHRRHARPSPPAPAAPS